MAMHIMGNGRALAGKGGATDWAGPGRRWDQQAAAGRKLLGNAGSYASAAGAGTGKGARVGTGKERSG